MAKHSFNDFSGGITDFKFNTQSNFSEVLDNWLVLRDKSIEVRYGFDIYSQTAPRILNPQRINAVLNIDGKVLFFADGKIYQIDNNVMTEITGPSTNKALNFASPDAITDIQRWGDHYICVDDEHSFPVKVYTDQNGNIKVVNAGLPNVSNEPGVAPDSDEGTNYIYAFVYEYEYLIGTTKYLDLGEPTTISISNGAILGVQSHTITGITELINGEQRNYDTANIRKRIYRSINNGTTLYLVDTIDNNVTTYIDSTSDDDLKSGEIIYTQGGIKPNNLPPQAKYIAISSNVAWYANIIEGAEVKPFRLRFSKVADIDSCPLSFFEDFESSITGISSIEDRVIVFTEDEIVRLEGVLDDLGRGVISRNNIADVGCVSNGSIVTTQDYVYWFGPSGIYRSDGVQYEKLTNHLDLTYQAWTNSTTKTRKIKGAYDNINQRVYWCINESDSDNDKILVFDEIHQGFTTMSSGVDFSPTAILFKDQEMIRCDKDGYIFVHTENTSSDLIKNVGGDVSLWKRKVIPYEWKHIAWDFGDSERTKWLNKINITGRPKSNVYLEPRAYLEGSPDYYKLSAVRFNPLMRWGDPLLLWGDSANRWNSVDYLNQAKRMARKAKRATHLQLAMSSAEITIQSSSANTNSYVTVNPGTSTISLLNPAIYKFSIGNEGHKIEVNGRLYDIISNSDSAVIVEDSNSTLVSGSFPYKIIGKPKAQRPHLSTVSIMYEYFGDSDKLTESGA